MSQRCLTLAFVCFYLIGQGKDIPPRRNLRPVPSQAWLLAAAELGHCIPVTLWHMVHAAESGGDTDEISSKPEPISEVDADEVF